MRYTVEDRTIGVKERVGHSSLLTQREWNAAKKDRGTMYFVKYAGSFYTDNTGQIVAWGNDSGHWQCDKKWAGFVEDHWGLPHYYIGHSHFQSIESVISSTTVKDQTKVKVPAPKKPTHLTAIKVPEDEYINPETATPPNGESEDDSKGTGGSVHKQHKRKSKIKKTPEEENEENVLAELMHGVNHKEKQKTPEAATADVMGTYSDALREYLNEYDTGLYIYPTCIHSIKCLMYILCINSS